MALVSAVLPRKDEERFRLHEVMRVVALMVVLLLFPVLFDYVGFVIPSMLVIVFMMRVLSKESWLRSLIVAVSTTALGYVLFGTFLNVRLPAFSMPF